MTTSTFKSTGHTGGVRRPGRWLALSVLVLAVLLVAVDATVLGLATPFLSEDLEPTAPSCSGSATSTPSSSPDSWSPWAASATASAARSCS